MQCLSRSVLRQWGSNKMWKRDDRHLCFTPGPARSRSPLSSLSAICRALLTIAFSACVEICSAMCQSSCIIVRDSMKVFANKVKARWIHPNLCLKYSDNVFVCDGEAVRGAYLDIKWLSILNRAYKISWSKTGGRIHGSLHNFWFQKHFRSRRQRDLDMIPLFTLSLEFDCVFIG